MKRTELEKRKGLAIGNALRRAGNPYGAAATTDADRKARRDADRAAGLVPFAVKLPADLVRALQAQADRSGQPISDLTADMLRDGLDLPQPLKR
jgi:hypothetical protein